MVIKEDNARSCLCYDFKIRVLLFSLYLSFWGLFYKFTLVTLAMVSKHVESFACVREIVRGDAIDLVADELRYLLVVDFCLGDFILKRLMISDTLRMLSLSFQIVAGVFDMDNGLFMLIIYFLKYHRKTTLRGQNYYFVGKSKSSDYCCQAYNLKMNSRMKTHKTQNNEQNALDPLNIHELIFEERIFLPLIEPNSHQSKVHPLIFRLMRAKNQAKMIVYILSDADLYFLYKIEILHETLTELNTLYQLSLKKLPDFIEFLKLSLEDIQNQQKMGILELKKDYNTVNIVFILKKIVGGKSHVVMQLKGQQQASEVITEHVAYMYGHIQDRIQQKESKIEQLKQLVRLKNPYLLKNFKQI